MFPASFRAPLLAAVASTAVLALAGGAHAATVTNGAAWLWAEQPDATATYTPNVLYSYNSSGKAVTVTFTDCPGDRTPEEGEACSKDGFNRCPAASRTRVIRFRAYVRSSRGP